MPPAIFDACCLIDLLVSGHMEAILRASGFAWRIPTAVQSEIQYVRQYDPGEAGAFIKVPVDLGAHFRSGLLSLCKPENAREQDRFVQYAAQFHSDGEAMFLAIAETRRWQVATDDRKAARVAREAGLTVMSCPELVKVWADTTRPGQATLSKALQNIQALAQFKPHPELRHYKWWESALAKAGP